MSVNAGKDLTTVYDTSGYLSKLLLTAYELDEVFHDTLRDIFEIDVSTGKSPDGSILYHAGPIQRFLFAGFNPLKSPKKTAEKNQVFFCDLAGRNRKEKTLGNICKSRRTGQSQSRK